MGLDVYFHRVKRGFNGDPTNANDIRTFTEDVDKDAQNELREFIDKETVGLKEAWDKSRLNEYWLNHYNQRYFEFVEKLRKKIAMNYDFKIHPYTNGILPWPELEEKLNNEVEMAYEEYDAYFRKVNFIFAFFSEKMVDEYFSFVEKSDVEELIRRCEDVLADHSKAQELLPTQSGFFFGSTNYDEWYFDDVKDCLEQMKKFLADWEDGETAYVIFSW